LVVYDEGMKYFTPIFIPELNRKVYFNPKTFDLNLQNIKRLANGLSPVGVDDRHVTLHHIGQCHTSNLVTVTDTVHVRYRDVLHGEPPAKKHQVNRNKFKREKRIIWQAIFDWLNLDTTGI
jgi:hypothetical protein